MTKQEYKKQKRKLKKENHLRIHREKKSYRKLKKELKARKKELKRTYRDRIDSLDEQTDERVSFLKEQYRENRDVVREKDLPQEDIETMRKARRLPSYTHGEEVFNSVTHIVGGGFGVLALIAGILFSVFFRPGDVMALLSMILFGVSMIMLYTVSAIYHGLHINKGKEVFQVLDHCTIYLLIAGSYTPVVLLGLKRFSPWNHVFLLFVYLLAILGIVLNATMMRKKAVKIVSMILYLLIGWAIIAFAPWLCASLKTGGFVLLVAGGVSYSVGSILYGVGKKKRYMHSIFHLFVNLGTLLQFLSVLLYLIIGL